MRVLVPPPRESRYHEVASAADVGQGRRRREDTHAVFSLPGPGGDWPILVLAVADGLGGRGSGRLASAVAIDAFGEMLHRTITGVEFSSWTWQAQVRDAIEHAFAHANAEVRGLRAEGGDGAEVATGLTVAILISDWLCIGHAGRGRAYRLQGNALEQLTSDRSSPPVLGGQPQVLPETRFTRVASGDVIAVCTDGLYRYVDGEELGRWLSSRDGLMDILVDVLTATADRGGDEDTSICLCRMRRLPEEHLPEPAPRADKAVISPEFPHFTVTPAPRIRPARLLFALATLAVGIGAIGGSLGWWTRGSGGGEDLRKGWVTGSRLPDTSGRAEGARNPSPDTGGIPAGSAASDQLPDTSGSPVAGDQSPVAAAAPAVNTDSVAAVQAIRDSVRRARREEARVRDSIAAADEAARVAAEAAYRDSVNRALVAARRRADSIARAAEDARLADERAEATRRAAAAAATEMRSRRITAGRAVLNSWAQAIAPAAEAGDRNAPSIAAGPGSFASFVAGNKPRLEGVQMTGMDVNDSAGHGTAEWTARWRGEFGATVQRRMRVAVDAARDGDVWRVTGWRFLEGAP